MHAYLAVRIAKLILGGYFITMNYYFRLVVAALLFALIPANNLSASPPVKPHVILISLDTVSAKHLSVYGYQYETTPFINEFARGNILFENVVSQAAYTLPSHFSLFTGVYPQTHHMLLNSWNGTAPDALSTKIKTLPQYMRDAGYDTFWSGMLIVNQLDLEGGLSRGFNHLHRNLIDDPTPSGIAELRYVLRSAKAHPSFIFLHTYLAHDPYRPIPPFDTKFGANHKRKRYQTQKDLSELDWKYRLSTSKDPTPVRTIWNKQFSPGNKHDLDQLRTLYDGGLHNLDEHVKRLFHILKEEGMYENSIIILTSDHGESFGENGEFRHQSPYRTQLQVPLVMKIPGWSARHVAANAYTIDILPTVLDLLGIKGDAVIEGDSLLPLIKGQAPERHPGFVYAAGFKVDSISDGKWKLLARFDGRRELYRCEEDPGETKNVAASFPQEVLRLDTALKAFKASRLMYKANR